MPTRVRRLLKAELIELLLSPQDIWLSTHHCLGKHGRLYHHGTAWARQCVVRRLMTTQTYSEQRTHHMACGSKPLTVVKVLCKEALRQSKRVSASRKAYSTKIVCRRTKSEHTQFSHILHLHHVLNHSPSPTCRTRGTLR